MISLISFPSHHNHNYGYLEKKLILTIETKGQTNLSNLVVYSPIFISNKNMYNI